MRSTRWFWFTLVMLAMLAVFACGNESDNYYNNYGNEYSNDYSSDYNNNTGSDEAVAEEEYEDYTMSPEDCYEDEEYDPVDEMCYPIYECEGDECEAIDEAFYTLVDDLLGEYLSGDEDVEEEGVTTSEAAIITYEVQGNKIINPEPGAVTVDLRAYQDDAARARTSLGLIRQPYPGRPA